MTKTELIFRKKNSPLFLGVSFGEPCHCLTVNICNQHQSRFRCVNLSCDKDKYERKYPLVTIAVDQSTTRNGCKVDRSPWGGEKRIHHPTNEKKISLLTLESRWYAGLCEYSRWFECKKRSRNRSVNHSDCFCSVGAIRENRWDDSFISLGQMRYV